MTHTTGLDLLVLHAVRTLGYADTSRIAARLSAGVESVHEQLLDAQAQGWVTWSSYRGEGGWSLTEAGKASGERRLAVELDGIGARAAVEEVHQEFLPLNEEVVAVCTAWQLAELGAGDGPVSLDTTVGGLGTAAVALSGLERRLTRRLERFGGYHSRFAAALHHAVADPRWITGTDRDSCHRVWFELHEDLIATLGLTR